LSHVCLIPIFAAGFVRALKIFAVCFGLRLAFGQYPYAGLSLSLGVIPCLLAGRLADICQKFPNVRSQTPPQK
jgi:hypothetical protein